MTGSVRSKSLLLCMLVCLITLVGELSPHIAECAQPSVFTLIRQGGNLVVRQGPRNAAKGIAHPMQTGRVVAQGYLPGTVRPRPVLTPLIHLGGANQAAISGEGWGIGELSGRINDYVRVVSLAPHDLRDIASINIPAGEVGFPPKFSDAPFTGAGERAWRAFVPPAGPTDGPRPSVHEPIGAGLPPLDAVNDRPLVQLGTHPSYCPLRSLRVRGSITATYHSVQTPAPEFILVQLNDIVIVVPVPIWDPTNDDSIEDGQDSKPKYAQDTFGVVPEHSGISWRLD